MASDAREGGHTSGYVVYASICLHKKPSLTPRSGLSLPGMRNMNAASVTWARSHGGHDLAQHIFAYAVQHGMFDDWKDPRFQFLFIWREIMIISN